MRKQTQLELDLVNTYKEAGIPLPKPEELEKVVLTRKMETKPVKKVKKSPPFDKYKLPKVKQEASAISAKIDENCRNVLLEAVAGRTQELIDSGMGKGEAAIQSLHEAGYAHLYAQSDTHETLAQTIAKIPERPEPVKDFRDPSLSKAEVDALFQEQLDRGAADHRLK